MSLMSRAARTGWMIFVILAVLTVVEYFIATGVEKNIPVIAVIAVIKAVLIINYFMHISAAWRGEHGHDGSEGH